MAKNITKKSNRRYPRFKITGKQLQTRPSRCNICQPVREGIPWQRKFTQLTLFVTKYTWLGSLTQTPFTKGITMCPDCIKEGWLESQKPDATFAFKVDPLVMEKLNLGDKHV